LPLSSLLCSVLAVGLLTACASRPPVLEPLPLTAAPGSHDIVVQVRPLDTSLGSDDRRRYEVDLGAYFSAFLVSVENRTSGDVQVDLSSSTLADPSGHARSALTGEDVVKTYRRGRDGTGSIEVVSKAPAVVRLELERIRAAQATPTTLSPGSQVAGAVLFSPISGPCGQSVLTVRGIDVVEDPRGLEFQFPLTTTCDQAPDAAAQ
jgi:hypothetical protein